MNISVIIPVYNVERYVERCIISIMNQTYTEGVECIIVNDFTPDRSMEIIEELVAKYNGAIQFKLLYHEYNRGVAAVRNTGMNAAIGDYIIQIDSDDYCELDMLEKMYAKAVEEDADVVVADFWITDKNDVYCSNIVPEDAIEIMKNTLSGKLGYLWCKLIRRSYLLRNNIENKEGLDFKEDMLMSFLLFYYKPKVVHLAKAFVHYVQYNNESYTRGTVSKKILENLLEGEHLILDFISKKSELSIPLNSAVLTMRVANLRALLLSSGGLLQKKWCYYYNDLTFYDVIKYSPFGIITTITICLAVSGMLPVYNFMRIFWRFLRRERSACIVIYYN